MNIGGTAVGTGINAEPEYPALMIKYLQQASEIRPIRGQGAEFFFFHVSPIP